MLCCFSLFYVYECICPHVWLCTTCVPSAQGGQYCDRSYRFELQMAVSHSVGTGNRTHVLQKKVVLFLTPELIILRIMGNCMIDLILIKFCHVWFFSVHKLKLFRSDHIEVSNRRVLLRVNSIM